jgi:CBS domain-containing protein
MLVRDVMTPDPVTVTPETGGKVALVRLADLGITAMPVVGHQGRLLGIVSEADLIREAVARDPRAQERPIMMSSLHAPRPVEDV